MFSPFKSPFLIDFILIVHQHTFSSILFYGMSMSIKLVHPFMFRPRLMCIAHNSMSPIDVLFVKNNFSIDLRIQLKLPYPSITCLLGCVCIHPIDPLGIHLLRCSHGMNALGHITQCLGIHLRKLVFMWFKSNYTFFLLPCFKHLSNVSTLSFLNTRSKHLWTLSSQSFPCKYFGSHMIFHA